MENIETGLKSERLDSRESVGQVEFEVDSDGFVVPQQSVAGSGVASLAEPSFLLVDVVQIHYVGSLED